MMNRPTKLFERESLPEAAWWANLRLEAYLAVVNQVPFPSYLNSLCADKKGAPVDDKDWANLMLLHMTDIIRYSLCGAAERHNLVVGDKTRFLRSYIHMQLS
ncbi:hypothetical protein LB505_011136 [Fusarium chuoi]|nr:hypothetical protein LB505_011136 [Fusarium chuoi]